MADINDIVSKQAVQGILDANKALQETAKSLDSVIAENEKLKKQLDETATGTNDLAVKSTAYTKILTATEKEQQKINAAAKQMAATQQQLINVESQLNNARNEEAVTILKKKKLLQEENEIVKLNTIINDKNSGTIEKAAAENKKLAIEKKKLNLETDEGIKRLKEINDLQDENNAIIKATGNEEQQRVAGIGQYKQQLGSLVEEFKAGNIGAAQMAKGVIQANKAMVKSFLSNPILWIVMGIVGAFAMLYAALNRNQGSADKMAQVWGGIKNVFQEVISRVFELAGAIGKLFKGDFKGAAESAKAAVTGFGEAVKKAYEEGGKLVKMQQDFEKATIKSITNQAKLTAEIEKQTAIADDATLSFEARQNASKKAGELMIQQAKENISLAQQEKAIAEENLRIANEQGRNSRELEKTAAEAVAKLIEADSNYNKQVFENAKQQRELKSDLFEKDLDILIDGFDKQKTINEQRIADDRLTFEERRNLLVETQKLSDDSFNKQIETVKKFTGANIDANDLLTTSDAVALNEKIRSLGLSEIYEGRLLEVINERKLAVQDFSVAEKDLNAASLKAEDDKLKKDKELAKASIDFALSEADREYRRKVMLINATTKDKEEAAKKIYELDVQSAQASIDTMNNAMNSINATEEEKWQYKEKIAQAQMDLDTLVADHEIDTAEKVAEKKKKLQESIYEASMQVSGALFDFMDAKYSGELAKLEQKNEQGLLSDKEYATQKAEIEIKQAKASRARAIFDATVNTATAIIKALADPGGIAGIILSVAAGVTGALQLASILSQPLPVMPAFATGTKNAPETFRAGERGRELGLLKTGEAVIFEKDGIYSDPKYKGARILPNAETEAMFRNQTLAPQYRSNSISDTRIVSELKSVKKAIVNSQRPIFSSRGEIIGTQTGNHRNFNHSKRYTPWA